MQWHDASITLALTERAAPLRLWAERNSAFNNSERTPGGGRFSSASRSRSSDWTRSSNSATKVAVNNSASSCLSMRSDPCEMTRSRITWRFVVEDQLLQSQPECIQIAGGLFGLATRRQRLLRRRFDIFHRLIDLRDAGRLLASGSDNLRGGLSGFGHDIR